MSYQNQKFGMMDEGYFVARSQIFTWINQLLQLNITKIQALGTGAIYCQIVDVIHPGKISLSKVNWKAKNDYEFLPNFRLLQTAFQKIGIKRHIEVQRLIKAKYQDNLEFIQWLKRYFDLNCGNRGEGYKAAQRRGNTTVDFGFAEKNIVPKTYNATGLVIPKSPNKRRQDVPDRLRSPKQVTSPMATNRLKGTISSQKKKQSVVIRGGSKNKIKQKQKYIPKKTQEKTSNKQLQGKVPQQKNQYQKQIIELRQKMQMIRQVAFSNDNEHMKLQMIKQIVKIQQGSNQSEKTSHKTIQDKLIEQNDLKSIIKETQNQDSSHIKEQQQSKQANEFPKCENQSNLLVVNEENKEEPLSNSKNTNIQYQQQQLSYAKENQDSSEDVI